MPIEISQQFPIYKQKINGQKQFLARSNYNEQDCFTPSFGRQNRKRSWFERLFVSEPAFADIDIPDSTTPEYMQELSKGLKSCLEIDIPPQNLLSIMTPEEFRRILPHMTADNYTASPGNLYNGVYLADLDYQTNYSGGKKNLFDLLERLTAIANQFYTDKQQKFIFAIADKDSLESVQQLIRLIGQNPEKYQNLKILPAVKLSFAHEAPTSNIGYENSEMIIYGINPFSKDLVECVDNLNEKRKEMVVEFIKRVNNLYPEFSYRILEFAEQNRLRYSRDYNITNLYWRAREYAESKGDIAIRGTKLVPQKIIQEANAIINSLGDVKRGSDQQTKPRYGSLLDENSEVNQSIRSVFSDYSTHEDKDGNIISSAEHLYDDLITCLGNTKGAKPVIALASPFYLSHYFEEPDTKTYDNVVSFIEKLKRESGGMLCAFETVVPAYKLDKGINPETIKKFNHYIRKHTNLYEVGGSFENISE